MIFWSDNLMKLILQFLPLLVLNTGLCNAFNTPFATSPKRSVSRLMLVERHKRRQHQDYKSIPEDLCRLIFEYRSSWDLIEDDEFGALLLQIQRNEIGRFRLETRTNSTQLSAKHRRFVFCGSFGNYTMDKAWYSGCIHNG